MCATFRKYGLCAVLLAGVTALGAIEACAQTSDHLARTETVEPDPAKALRVVHVKISVSERTAIKRRMSERKNANAVQARSAKAASEAGEVQEPAPVATSIGGADLTEAAKDFIIGHNAKNPLAALAGNSTLAEPAAVNWRGKVLYAGNFDHLEWSSNHGVSYTKITVPGGPPDAPIACCDNDIVIDDKGVAYHSILYINSALTNGVVRIFVRPQGSNFTASCSYTHDPGGGLDNITPDYPHIALSKNYLYLTYNATGAGGGFARIRRYNLAQLRACQAVTVNTFTQNWGALGQRVWTPAEGGYNQARMMWIQHESTNQIKIFEWLESSASVTSVLKTVQSSNFSNPDCRGGIGNFDFVERPTSWSIAGFRTRCTMAVGPDQPAGGVLACYWHSAATGNFPNSHVRAAHFSLTTKNLLSQPHIWNANYCFGYPVVTSNKRGAIGYSLAFGGKTGGGGPALKGAVGMFDTFGRNFTLSADGVAMRSDGRFGDYLTIHPYRGCSYWFGATSYAWKSQPVDSGTDVNARWVEFGRAADLACWKAGQ